MKQLWLDIGNTRLKYWITQNDTVLAHAAELHLQSPADLLLGLIQYFKTQQLEQIGVSSVLDANNNQRIVQILNALNVPVCIAKVVSHYAGLHCGYDVPAQLGVDRWLQVLAVAQAEQNYCVIGCGTALTIDLVDGLQHQGGYILPNLYLQRDALIHNTKGIKIPDSAFAELSPGRNTVDAVHHGILLGLVSAIARILELPQPQAHTRESTVSPRRVVFTGGDAALLASFFSAYDAQVEPDLLLKGLQRYVQYQAHCNNLDSACHSGA